jgi:hypothetical protein
MTRGSVRVVAVALTAAAVAAGACSRQPKDNELSSGPSGTSVREPHPTPLDHLAPGELVEGSQKAFGLALPRDMTLTQSFVDLVSATGPVSVHALVQYLSTRLEGGSLREGAETATFEHVSARGDHSFELRIKVSSMFGGSRLEVYKVQRPPATANPPDEEARWRQVGLTPQGKVIDPAHFE